jgi:hypothetical protein
MSATARQNGVGGIPVTWDILHVTWREWIALEAAFPGVYARDIQTNTTGRYSSQEFAALLWVFRRRDDPGVTPDDIMDAGQLDYIPVLRAAGVDDDDDPEGDDGEPNPPPPPGASARASGRKRK